MIPVVVEQIVESRAPCPSGTGNVETATRRVSEIVGPEITPIVLGNLLKLGTSSLQFPFCPRLGN